ncbi:MAG: ATP-binding protein [Oscillospiraceae bacterium]|nr:ATP-binding protein [Oscillospiraceae bacterium]
MINSIFIGVMSVLAVITIGTMYIVQTRMKSAKREYYVLYLICVTLYELGYILEMMANSTGGGIAAAKIFHLGTQFIMPFYLMFVQKYCEISIKKIINIFIFTVSVFIILLVWTSEWHTLFYVSYWFEETSGIHRLAVQTGPLYPLSFINAALCVAMSVFVIAKKMLRSGKERRGTYWLLIFLAVSPFVTSLLYVFEINIYGADVAPVLLVVIIMSIYWNIFKHDLLENEDTVRAQNWLREMVGNISHEMKTPLTVIAADIQLAERFMDSGKYDRAKERLREAWQETMQTANLVTDALTFSRGSNELKPMEHFSSGAFIEMTLTIFEPAVNKHGNTLVRDIAKPAKMYGNPDMLSVALVNLLLNANRHTSGGVIKVGWLKDGDNHRLTVSDTGSGISPEMLPRVFEHGVSGGNSTGLGLAVVKKVMELHEGTVNIESEVGKGTTVTLIFPVLAEEQK